jgi:hypothetical protein
MAVYNSKRLQKDVEFIILTDLKHWTDECSTVETRQSKDACGLFRAKVIAHIHGHSVLLAENLGETKEQALIRTLLKWSATRSSLIHYLSECSGKSHAEIAWNDTYGNKGE